MVYTHSKKADLVVETELDIIKKIIIKRIPGVISIVLFGSFGKGEGSFIESGKGIDLLGDYDIYVVTKKNIKGPLLEKVSNECAEAIQKGNLEIVECINEQYDRKKCFHIDIRAIPYRKLNRLLPTQRIFDLKNSKIIYGKDLLNEIPDIKLSLSDALRLLFNMTNYLLDCKEREKEIKIINSMKVIQNSCAALLIAENKYSSTYEKRNEIFQKTDFPEKVKKITDKATKFKLRSFFNIDENKIWQEAKNFLGFSIKYVLEKQAHKTFNNWKEMGDFIANKLAYSYFEPYLPSKYLFPAQYYLNLKFIIACWKKNERIIKPIFTWKDAGLKLAASLLMFLYNEEELAEKYLKQITNKTYPLRKRILKIYIIYFNQKLI